MLANALWFIGGAALAYLVRWLWDKWDDFFGSGGFTVYITSAEV